jgi:hypothetical protein
MTFVETLRPITERRFQRQVTDYARLMGWRVREDRATNQRRDCAWCRRPLCCAACSRPVSVLRNDAGMLDLILIRRPRIVWAELKSERGKLTVEQAACVAELRACGQEVFVWRPRDWEAIERCLK